MDSYSIEQTFNLLLAMLAPKKQYDVFVMVQKAKEKFVLNIVDQMEPLNEDELTLVKIGEIVSAIKAYRYRTNCSLYEAKNKIDAVKA